MGGGTKGRKFLIKIHANFGRPEWAPSLFTKSEIYQILETMNGPQWTQIKDFNPVQRLWLL